VNTRSARATRLHGWHSAPPATTGPAHSAHACALA
jgi:hypothetical protein